MPWALPRIQFASDDLDGIAPQWQPARQFSRRDQIYDDLSCGIRISRLVMAIDHVLKSHRPDRFRVCLNDLPGSMQRIIEGSSERSRFNGHDANAEVRNLLS